MDEYVFFDGRIVTADEAAISPVMSAALYGKGIFTTIAINNGELFLWEKHWRRLSDSADRVEIDLSEHSKETTKKAIEEILRRNELTQARVRLTFFDESSNNIWHREAKQKATLLITTGEKRQVNENFRLTISPYLINSLSPLAGIKSCNYLEKLMASNESKNRGFEEAVQVNERGETTSATMANVFWLKGDTLYTPSLKTGCLPGTTREFVLENLDCCEVEQTIENLHYADSIFLTSAGLGVVQAVEFEGRKFSPVSHPILNLLSKS